MAIGSASLNNMSVRTDTGAGNQGLLMPKLQFRFRVLFFGLGGIPNGSLELTKQVMDCSRPQVQFDEITLNVYNSRIYLAGKHTWQPMNINVRDDASGQVSKMVGRQLQKQLDFFQQASAVAGVDYKFTTRIQILDGGNGSYQPQQLETWDLLGCYLQQANYNQLNYATSDQVSIALTIRFDNALQAEGQGVGDTVNRTSSQAATGSNADGGINETTF